MAHITQDWEPVILRKDSGKPKQPQRAPESKKLDNLLSDDTEPPKTVGSEVGKQLEQGRCAKKTDTSPTRQIFEPAGCSDSRP